MRIALLAATIGAALISPAATAAPTGLFNKTVRVSYGFYIPGKSAVGTTNGGGRSVTTIIYISSAGRVFSKQVARASRGSSGEDVMAAPDRTAGHFDFAGNTMVATRRFGNAAGRMTVKFDPGFQTCTADFIVGGENGAPMTWVGLNGEKYTQVGPPTFSSVTCSVQSGNAFAN